MKPVRFAILGAGNTAQRHAGAIRSVEHAELMMVWSRTAARAAELVEAIYASAEAGELVPVNPSTHRRLPA